jgi:hypothetical protein
MNVLLVAAYAVIGYVLLSLVRAFLFPRKPPAPLEYKPRQVGGLAISATAMCNICPTSPAIGPCFSRSTRAADRALHEGGEGASHQPPLLTAAGRLAASAARPIAASLQQALSSPHILTVPLPHDLHSFPQMGDMTLLELSKYDGRDPFRPLLLAVRGRVYDVTLGRAFYGPGACISVPIARGVQPCA